jgi:acyl-CoA thioester hydrolase
MPPADQIVSQTTIPVRFAETDAMGIVHHAAYVVYLEQARVEYAKTRGSDYMKLVEAGYHLAVAEISLRYAAPARFGATLIVRCWLEELKSRSMTFAYAVSDSEMAVSHATGQSKHICVTSDGKVARIPDFWLRSF